MCNSYVNEKKKIGFYEQYLLFENIRNYNNILIHLEYSKL